MIIYSILFLSLYGVAVYLVEHTDIGQKLYNKIFKD